MSHVQINQSD
jgi:hypothetical protein